MKLVLLPGLDGTGKLFAPILPLLDDHDVVVMPLPQTGTQTYVELSQQVRYWLPREDFVLVAESFSGPIAAVIAQEDNTHLKGIVFVASFLSPPAPVLSRLAMLLPLRTMIKLPGANLAIRLLCLGRDATEQEVASFKEAVLLVPAETLKARLRELGRFSLQIVPKPVSACLLQAKGDVLVGGHGASSVRQAFPSVETQSLDGPHFLAQSRPKEAAQHITDFLVNLELQQPRDGELQRNGTPLESLRDNKL